MNITVVSDIILLWKKLFFPDLAKGGPLVFGKLRFNLHNSLDNYKCVCSISKQIKVLFLHQYRYPYIYDDAR